MKRKPTPPTAEPRSAEIINLAARRQASSTKSESRSYPTPEGWQQGDEFTAIHACESARYAGIRVGDVLMCFKTLDVQKGDFAVLEVDDGEEGCPYGLFDSDECYYYVDDERYHRSITRVKGRVTEIQRAAQRITPKIILRPTRQKAAIYQFKQRA